MNTLRFSTRQSVPVMIVALIITGWLLQACGASNQPKSGESSAQKATDTPMMANTAPAAPAAGYWEGDPGVAFTVTPEGQVLGFRITVPFPGTGACTIEETEQIVISPGGTFSTSATAPVGEGGQEIATHVLEGVFEDRTHATGKFSVSWCDQNLQSTPSQGEWRAEWKGKTPPTPIATATLAATQTPPGLSGIDQPVTVEGISLQLISARLAEEIPMGASPRSASNPAVDQLLRVDARVLEGTSEAAAKWGDANKVWVTDETGKRIYAPGSIYNAVRDNGNQTVSWVFEVPKTSRDFTLYLPDGTEIDLTPLLEGYTAPAKATSTAVPAGAIEPVFEDYFTDNANFWTGLYKNEKVDVNGGRMKVTGQPGSYTALAYCSGKCGPYEKHYFVQADFSREKQTENGFGLVFGLNKGDYIYYLLVIYPQDGQFALLKQINAEWQTLVDWTNSPEIRPDPQANTLAADFNAGKITLYINGTMVADYLDPSPIDPGRVGAFADNGYMGLLVENFKVYAENPYAGAP